MKKLIGVMVSVLLLASCASMGGSQMSAEQQNETGFLKGYYDRLQPGPEGGAKLRWIKPNVDFTRYTHVMLDSVVYFFADNSEYKGIDATELKELADQFNKALVDALQDSYPIVTEPGIDVVRIRFAITNLKQSYPGLERHHDRRAGGIGHQRHQERCHRILDRLGCHQRGGYGPRLHDQRRDCRGPGRKKRQLRGAVLQVGLGRGSFQILGRTGESLSRFGSWEID